MESQPKWLLNAYVLLCAVLPWSLDVCFGTWNLSLPEEPLLGGLALALAFPLWKNRHHLWQHLKGNLFLTISLAFLIWQSISACFSTDIMVSGKYLLVEWTHWWVFGLGILMYPGIWRRAFFAFCLSMSGLAVYTLIHFAQYHFRHDQAILAPMPFFPDHTMWAAVLSIVLFFSKITPAGETRLSPKQQKYLQIWFGIFALALFLSTCRAALIAVVMASCIGAFFYLKYATRQILLVGIGLMGIGAGIWFNRAMPQDVSSKERLNRWHCAMRMSQEKPIMGYGPGAYQFQYIDFQRPEDMTRISLHAPQGPRTSDNHGRGGGAHSEYLRALSEAGWPGLILLLLLAALPLRTLFLSRRGTIPFWVALALIAYFLHGVVNDFLHDGRIGALVWSGLAILHPPAKEEV